MYGVMLAHLLRIRGGLDDICVTFSLAGNLLTYTFGEQSDGCATLLSNADGPTSAKHPTWYFSDSFQPELSAFYN